MTLSPLCGSPRSETRLGGRWVGPCRGRLLLDRPFFPWPPHPVLTAETLAPLSVRTWVPSPLCGPLCALLIMKEEKYFYNLFPLLKFKMLSRSFLIRDEGILFLKQWLLAVSQSGAASGKWPSPSWAGSLSYIPRRGNGCKFSTPGPEVQKWPLSPVPGIGGSILRRTPTFFPALGSEISPQPLALYSIGLGIHCWQTDGTKHNLATVTHSADALKILCLRTWLYLETRRV